MLRAISGDKRRGQNVVAKNGAVTYRNQTASPQFPRQIQPDMAHVTIRILDGADRGRVFPDLETPITIGREEGNSIQLNDERVSRYHLKIQEDRDRLVLTDLESTNGTKVNGEVIRLRILRFGDLLGVGRSLLLVGSRAQIEQRIAAMRSAAQADEATSGLEELLVPEDMKNGDLDLGWTEDRGAQTTLQCLIPAELPQGLSPGQAAQLSDLLSYLHIRMRDLITSAREKNSEGDITLRFHEWQGLLDLQARLAKYLNEIGEPEG